MPLCWVCRLESVYGIARKFLSQQGGGRSRTGVVSGGPCRRRTAGKLPENRRRTAGKPPAKPPGNRREKPRFWVTFASLKKGREGSGKASPTSFFRPWGRVGHGGVFPRLNVCTFPSDGVGGTGSCGFLSVPEGLFGPIGGFSEFHEEATPKGVYTDSYTPHKGGAYFRSDAILRTGIKKPCGGR